MYYVSIPNSILTSLRSKRVIFSLPSTHMPFFCSQIRFKNSSFEIAVAIFMPPSVFNLLLWIKNSFKLTNVARDSVNLSKSCVKPMLFLLKSSSSRFSRLFNLPAMASNPPLVPRLQDDKSNTVNRLESRVLYVY